MKLERVSLNALKDKIDGDIDLFVCSASYEARCRSVADQIAPARVRHALVAETEHRDRYVSPHGDHLRQMYGERSHAALLSSEDPVVTADALLAGIEVVPQDARGEANVLVDITTFTHESLLILVKLLTVSGFAARKTRFVYASAAEYSVGDDNSEKWLSKGVHEVRSVLGFPGEMLPSRRQHLIVLVGFEHERAAELIQTYEPSVITLGHGRAGSATSKKHEAANRHFHGLVTSMASTYGRVRKFDFACNDPIDTCAAIEKQMRGVKSMNTVIAPMNTKLSTLGAVLAAKRHEAIQLCYARASQYNYKAYSAPGTDCYLVELPELFGVDPA
jgi:hypothetical protein